MAVSDPGQLNTCLRHVHKSDGSLLQVASNFFPRGVLTMQKMEATFDKNLNRLGDLKASFHRPRRKFLTCQFLCAPLSAATTFHFYMPLHFKIQACVAAAKCYLNLQPVARNYA
jgi:hypothetical protein